MTNGTMWMVRAGEYAYLLDKFRRNNVVAIGWNEVGDLSNATPEEVKKIVKEKYPDYKKGKLNITASQLIKFRFRFKKGDYVITYDPEERVYLVGKVVGDYEFNPKDIKIEYFHIRRVKWMGKAYRDSLSTSTKNTLGAISALFEVTESAKEEILQLLGRKNLSEYEEKESDEEEMETIKEDMMATAHEFIKDKILSLNWEEMEELVAGLLRAMGYKTMLTPKGPDRGRDIFASPDGLGLEDPRIIVEVKHRTGQVNAKEMRSFIGGLRQGMKGLYVSTGGFSKDAKYEAERSTIPVTLLNLDTFAKLITQYYDGFDGEAKKLIPLVKIYWPA
jgi:restriction system protein